MELEALAPTKSHEDTISISSGSSEEVKLVKKSYHGPHPNESCDSSASDEKEPNNKKQNECAGKEKDEDIWHLTEEFDCKEDGQAKMEEMDNCALVRLHNSNFRCLCFECCAHLNCQKK